MTKLTNGRFFDNGVWLVILVIILAGMTGWAFGQAGKGPEKPSVIKSAKGDITFSHAEHGGIEGGCNACHAMFPPKSGQIEALKSSGKLKEKAVMQMCRDCHGKLMAANKETGPTADCIGCHRK